MLGIQHLWKLAAAQLALGIVAGIVAPIELPDIFGLASILPPYGLQRILIVPLFPLAMSQAVLIALWAMASTSSRWRRLAGLIAGAAYLDSLLALGLNAEFLGLATVAIALTSASLFVVRALGIKLARQDQEAGAGRREPEGLKFSIRGLMIFTVIVALLSAGARTLQSSNGRFILMAAIWALCFGVVGLVALWAALGEARPKKRGAFVFALSPVLGTLFAYASGAHQAGCFLILMIMLLYPIVLVVSLFVVRSCGYRLVGRSWHARDKPNVGISLEPSSLTPPSSGATISG